MNNKMMEVWIYGKYGSVFVDFWYIVCNEYYHVYDLAWLENIAWLYYFWCFIYDFSCDSSGAGNSAYSDKENRKKEQDK